MSWWCKIFGHDTWPTVYGEFQHTGANFFCMRCGVRFKTFEEIKKK